MWGRHLGGEDRVTGVGALCRREDRWRQKGGGEGLEEGAADHGAWAFWWFGRWISRLFTTGGGSSMGSDSKFPADSADFFERLRGTLSCLFRRLPALSRGDRGESEKG